MSRNLLKSVLESMSSNPEQMQAVNTKTHCVVLAGPGSGKTKTLTAALAKAYYEDILPPRRVACITYNNECALELEARLAQFGLSEDPRIFIGTVHSFALTQIIEPYAHCVYPHWPKKLFLATKAQEKAAIEAAYKQAIGLIGYPMDRWKYAQEKRKNHVNRLLPNWKGENPDLAKFIEAYEIELRSKGLIDYDDMPLIAFDMLQRFEWIGNAIKARFPVLFVDEYQDLGCALHEIVLNLCLEKGIRLFAVGDIDQSVYSFNGANPSLLYELSKNTKVSTIELTFNYRCGTKIIDASVTGLGIARNYKAPKNTHNGEIWYKSTSGNLAVQAKGIMLKIVPDLRSKGIATNQIAVLYRTASHGTILANAANAAKQSFVRSDNEALIKRNSRVARFIEGCARWVTSGWKTADPSFRSLSKKLVLLILNDRYDRDIRGELVSDLISFLQDSRDNLIPAHDWLILLRDRIVSPWSARMTLTSTEWDTLNELIGKTALLNPSPSLEQLAGINTQHERLNLSTLHSAKGREFDAVIFFAMDNDIVPDSRDMVSAQKLMEARRLFYVGLSRARKYIVFCFTKQKHSPWIKELYDKHK